MAIFPKPTPPSTGMPRAAGCLIALLCLGVIASVDCGCTRKPSQAVTWKAVPRIATYVPPGQRYRISVLARSTHPFLTDSSVSLLVHDDSWAGQRLTLLADAGSGAEQNLYAMPDGRFLFVDANAHWYILNANAGTIRPQGWKFDEPVPKSAVYLGKFRHKGSQPDNTRFIPAGEDPEPTPTTFKDPDPTGIPECLSPAETRPTDCSAPWPEK